MTVEQLPAYLTAHWPYLRRTLLDGTYTPQPVRRVEIPKPDGGVRKLGIPTVRDRFVQQALLQVLQERFDPRFSKHSHGFRPNHSAHGAVAEAPVLEKLAEHEVVTTVMISSKRPISSSRVPQRLWLESRNTRFRSSNASCLSSIRQMTEFRVTD